MDDIIKSCDLLKKQNLQGGLGAYLNRSCDLPKKDILMAYISRSCNLPKKDILMAYISGHVIPPR